MKLSPLAERALDEVRVKEAALRSMKRILEDEFKASLDQKLEQFIEDRNIAVRMADEAGAPRTQIGRAMGTTNYRTVQDILEGVEPQSRPVSETHSEDGSWSCVYTNDGWRLTIYNLGPAKVSGTAIVRLDEGEITHLSGDEFVLPQIFRNNLEESVKNVMA